MTPREAVEDAERSQLDRYMPVPESGCWLWEGYTQDGYGVMRLGKRGAKKYAHRSFYEHHVGPVPKGMLICHKCDTPSCVNPDHLFAGTAADNNRDRKKKGRYMGVWNGRSKLTEAQARSVLSSSLTNSEAAKAFGLTYSTIWMLRAGKTWPHLQRNEPPHDH